MNGRRHGFVIALVTAVLAVMPLLQAHAQPRDKWPSRQIQLMAGFPVGGVIDTANRILIAKMQEPLGVQIIPLPTPGGGGALASQKLAKAPPDGYLLLTQTTGAMFTRPLLNNVPYSYKDFTPIATYAISVTTIAVQKDAPWRTLEDFIRDAKANPKKYSYASAGLGGLQHLAMDIVARKTGIDVVHVPYGGGPQTIAAVLGGQTALVVGDNIHPEIRALAITSPRRSPLMPGVPTMKELGYEVELFVRMSVIGPKGLPRDVVTRLESAVKSAASDPDIRKQLEDRGLEVTFESSDELERIWEKEAKLLKEQVESLGLAHYQQKKQ